MKTKIFVLALIFLFLFSCKDEPVSPYSSSSPTSEPKPKLEANVIFVCGTVSCGWYHYVDQVCIDQYGCSIFGSIKNIGNAAATAIKIHVKMVDSSGTILRSFSVVYVNPDYQYSYLPAGKGDKILYRWYGISEEHYKAFDETNSNKAKYITWENTN